MEKDALSIREVLLCAKSVQSSTTLLFSQCLSGVYLVIPSGPHTASSHGYQNFKQSNNTFPSTSWLVLDCQFTIHSFVHRISNVLSWGIIMDINEALIQSHTMVIFIIMKWVNVSNKMKLVKDSAIFSYSWISWTNYNVIKHGDVERWSRVLEAVCVLPYPIEVMHLNVHKYTPNVLFYTLCL